MTLFQMTFLVAVVVLAAYFTVPSLPALARSVTRAVRSMPRGYVLYAVTCLSLATAGGATWLAIAMKLHGAS